MSLHNLTQRLLEKARADQAYFTARSDLYKAHGEPDPGSFDYQRFEIDLKEHHGDKLRAAANADVDLMRAVNQTTEEDLLALVDMAKRVEE